MRLIGREEERRVIDLLIERTANGLSGSLVVRGEAGIGKTRLLEYAVEHAAGLHRALITGVESEADLSFSGLHRLLVPFLSYFDHLPDQQGKALKAAFGFGPELPLPAERFFVSLATLTLLSEVAGDRGLLVIADDAQWLDRESLEVLAFVSRRILAERIVILLGVRDPIESELPVDDMPSLHLSDLPKATALVLFSEAAIQPVTAPVWDRVFAEIGGNPLALKELSRELTGTELLGGSSLPGPLPIGSRLRVHYLTRVRGLAPDIQKLLLIASAETTGDVELFWKAMQYIGVSPATAAEAEASDLLVLRPHIGFRHPLIRSAVYTGAHAADRRQAHATLAAVTDRERDPDRWTWHLAASAIGPDAEIAAVLEEAAGRSRGRGGHSAVVTALIRSAELTLDGNERTRRYLSAAAEAVTAGEGLRAQELVNLSSAKTEVERARALRIRGDALRLDFRLEAPEVLVAAARAYQSFDTTNARAALLAALGEEGRVLRDGTGEALHALARSALDAAKPSGPEAALTDLFFDAFAIRVAVGHAAAAPLIRDALSTLRDQPAEVRDNELPWLMDMLAMDLWDQLGNREMVRRNAAFSREWGAIYALSLLLLCLANGETMAGQFDQAAALFAESRDLKMLPGQATPIHDIIRIELLAWQGKIPETQATLAKTVAYVAQGGVGSTLHLANLAVTVLELGRGRYQQARDSARKVFDVDPVGYGTKVLPYLIEAAVRSEDKTMTGLALERMSDRAQAAGTPAALGLLARCLAFTRHGTEAESLYCDSIDHLTASEALPELARSRLVFGEWLRRENRRRDARRQLSIAHEMLSSIGAELFAERAWLELRASGERARKRTVSAASDLTPQELRIARMAAQGATNPEIASQVYLSASTVDFHLKKVYRKLNISSRRQLGERLQPPD
jgi:DNA-binding CsgD family transcriptional regulator